ncbi:hypothetical protein ANO11243_013830 [Dothideomycetidae sp. 11243]|nr:hypothetical protein ANO11243_013830 [fungal sp. No.11243]
MPSTRSQTKEDTAPTCHVLDYAYSDDNDDGFTLTALVHTLRFYISVDLEDLKHAATRDEFLALLNEVRGQTQPEVQQTKKRKRGSSVPDNDSSPSTADSGYGGSSPASPAKRSASSINVTLADDDREESGSSIRQLQDWVLAPLGEVFATRAPQEEESNSKTVADWFHGEIFSYKLCCSDEDGSLEAVERENVTDELRYKISELIPSLDLPKYITSHNIPVFGSSDLQILQTADTPSPRHPAVVHSRSKDETFFLKLVDPTQPGPVKRELRLLKEIESKNLHQSIRVPLVQGVVVDDHTTTKTLPESTSRDSPISILGFLLTPIPNPTPLTSILDEDVAESRRSQWAKQVERTVAALHEADIIWGDAKADNFVVDKHQNLWIIDFGGSYTEGWVEEKYAETKKGDRMGVEKIAAAVRDPENMTFDPDEEQKEEEGPETKVRKLQHGQEEEEEQDKEQEEEEE